MKKNRLYIAGFLLAAVNLFSGCSEDDPSYANLVADKQELTINLDEKAEGVIQIIQETVTTRLPVRTKMWLPLQSTMTKYK